jgi:hypothetical protein
MKKIAVVGLALMMATAGKALSFTHELSYEGFPYNKTLCEAPTYMIGAQVKLSSGVPVKDNVPLVGWLYKGRVYLPGVTFTMPGMDVVLQPVWANEQGMEAVKASGVRLSGQKYLRNGQLVIVHDGIEYNVLGGRIQ